MTWMPFAGYVKEGALLSINKRFVLFLSVAVGISVIMLIAMMSWVIKVSPAINQAVDSTTDNISDQFIAMGYTNDSWNLVRPDPDGNQDSKVKIIFSNNGSLENVTCETAYINTRSAMAVYTDIEASVKIMGDTLGTQKDAVIKAIEDIRNNQSVRAGGDLENGYWNIVSSTFNDNQGGKLRYICFTARKSY